MTPDFNNALFEQLSTGETPRAADVFNEFTRAKMQEPGIGRDFVNALSEAQKRFDSLSPEEQERERARATAEFDKAEREWKEAIDRMAADPSQHVALCEQYCHEGLSIVDMGDFDDPEQGWVELGICSHYERFPMNCLPEWVQRRYDMIDVLPYADWPQPMVDALGRLVAHIKAEAERDALGC